MAEPKPTKKRSSRVLPPSKPAEPVVDSAAEFEALIKQAAADQHYVLRLYVTGNTARSAQAIKNIHSLCEGYLRGRYELEVIDIYQQPNEAVADQIIAAPTLVKELPEPAARMVGDLSNRDKILIGLNLAGPDSSKTKWAQM